MQSFTIKRGAITALAGLCAVCAAVSLFFPLVKEEGTGGSENGIDLLNKRFSFIPSSLPEAAEKMLRALPALILVLAAAGAACAVAALFLQKQRTAAELSFVASMSATMLYAGAGVLLLWLLNREAPSGAFSTSAYIPLIANAVCMVVCKILLNRFEPNIEIVEIEKEE